jgi:3',5'-cyclic AMP phosphodiesterase CpdA
MLIAQLSDTHIKTAGTKAYRVVETDALLRKAVQALNDLPQRPDAVIVSGDLVDRGLAQEYARLRTILAPLEQPVFLLPGNHDDRDALRDAFPDHGYLPGSGFMNYAVRQAHAGATPWPLRLLGLDTVDAGKGSGLFCPERLIWLAQTLDEDTQTPTLIFMHHPPFLTGIGHMDDIGLSGREAFSEIVSRHDNIRLISAGHLHRHISASVGGRLCMTSPSTAHAVQLDLAQDAAAALRMEPPGFLLHFWNGSDLVVHHGFTDGFPGPYPFFDDQGKLIL